MSSGEELKPSPPAAAPVDNITTAAAAESTKRPRDDADFVGGIDEDERKPAAKKIRTGSSANNPTSVEEYVEVCRNGTPIGKLIVGTSVKEALLYFRQTFGEGFLKDKHGVLVFHKQLLSAHRAPYDFQLTNPSPVETGGNRPPSDGRSMPRQSEVRYAPSTIDGKAEGLNHASNERNRMQCTSHPVCVRLLQLLETAIAERDTLDEKFRTASEHVLRAK